MFKKKKLAKNSSDLDSGFKDLGQGSNISDLIDRINDDFKSMKSDGQNKEIVNRSFTINGKEVSKEEMDENQREMKRLFEEKMGRFGVGDLNSLGSKAKTKYILNGKEVTKEELEAARSEGRSRNSDDFWK